MSFRCYSFVVIEAGPTHHLILELARTIADVAKCEEIQSVRMVSNLWAGEKDYDEIKHEEDVQLKSPCKRNNPSAFDFEPWR
jgi:hypothetical protein